MTRLHLERLDPPSSIHAARVRAWAGEQAAEELGGRRVWCAAASARGRDAAAALAQRLGAEAGAPAEPLVVDEGESARELAPRLDALLWGRPVADAPATMLDAADRTGWAEASAAAEVAIGHDVGVDDLVVVHDVVAALVAPAVRARGAHVVWHLHNGGRAGAPAASIALELVRPYTGTVDAYIFSAVQRVPGGSVLRVAAVMPSADLLAATEVVSSDPPGELAWRAALADVVADDRAEYVGGRRHVRPAVPVR
jgi:hypothetical protein